MGAIGAGYVQMYWLTFIKNKNWMGVLWTSLAIGVLYLAAQGLIYYIQFVTRIQEEEYNKKFVIILLVITLRTISITK